jgi:hypothetical protein
VRFPNGEGPLLNRRKRIVGVDQPASKIRSVAEIVQSGDPVSRLSSFPERIERLIVGGLPIPGWPAYTGPPVELAVTFDVAVRS